MQIHSATSPVNGGPALKVEAGHAAARPAGGTSFSQLMSQMLSEVDQSQQVVTQDMNKLLTGEVENIHDVAINVAKADVAFRLVMEVRDKLIAAYQDVMRMQV
ncbi:flagellar hook-basal body complex protein FliE [Planctomicrobium sp. SH661]|uniref:flagellar hook-basal body complex protein FliE n=1 Tax=Planctomicrobium sp. SH661 TaxID=3448124 RepID=UPI003F5B9CBA